MSYNCVAAVLPPHTIQKTSHLDWFSFCVSILNFDPVIGKLLPLNSRLLDYSDDE